MSSSTFPWRHHTCRLNIWQIFFTGTFRTNIKLILIWKLSSQYRYILKTFQAISIFSETDIVIYQNCRYIGLSIYLINISNTPIWRQVDRPFPFLIRSSGKSNSQAGSSLLFKAGQVIPSPGCSFYNFLTKVSCFLRKAISLIWKSSREIFTPSCYPPWADVNR